MGRPRVELKDDRGCDLVCNETFSNVSAELVALHPAMLFFTFIHCISRTSSLGENIVPHLCNQSVFMHTIRKICLINFGIFSSKIAVRLFTCATNANSSNVT